MDVSDAVSYYWHHQREATESAPDDPNMQNVRSVEIVEPVRRTVLTLEASDAFLNRPPEGATVYVDAHGEDRPWTVVSCNVEEVYP